MKRATQHTPHSEDLNERDLFGADDDAGGAWGLLVGCLVVAWLALIGLWTVVGWFL
jgi:hypothetical protein